MHSDVQSQFADLQTHRLLLPLSFLAMALAMPDALWAAGTQAGTLIENTARIDYTVDGTATTVDSNTATLLVDERIDVQIATLSPQVVSAPGDTNRALLFRISNTGNGSETFSLTINSVIPGDDFDPLPATQSLYFDIDASGDFSAGDVAYVPGNNDPLLMPDATLDILLLNDIPEDTANGQVGRSELVATAVTGSGVPGDVFPGQGEGGGDALVGSSGGSSLAAAEYLIADVELDIRKSVAISDPAGGSEPIPGATLTYSVTIAVTNSGIATNSVFADPIPTNTSYVNSSIALNGAALTDAVADDAGEFDVTAVPTVVVRLGDLTQADGVQTVSFDVVID